MITLKKLQDELARKDFLEFVVQSSGPNYHVAPCHREIAKVVDQFIEDIENGLRPVLVISQPPRSGKSHMVSERLPLYALGKHPEWEVVSCSYSADLATQFTFRALEMVRDGVTKDIFPNLLLNENKQKQNHWLTDKGGGFRGVGVGGSLTGTGAHLLIADDTVKDWEAAMSPRERDRVWDWWVSVAMTRLAPKSGIILCQTRWSVDDLTGRVLKKQREEGNYNIYVLNFPAIATRDEYPLVRVNNTWVEDISQEKLRSAGEALHPERYPLEMLLQTKANSERVWQSLYQGDPRPDGGRYIQTDAIRYIIESDLPKDTSAIRWTRGYDLAVKAGRSHDHSSSALLGVDKRGNLYLKHITNVKKTWNENKKFIVSIAKAERIRMAVETVAAFHLAYIELKNELKGIVHISEVKATTDKLTRALGWIDKIEAGCFYIIVQSEEEFTSGIFSHTKWVPALLEQMQNFDPDVAVQEDDMIDAVTVAFTDLFKTKSPRLII